MIEPDSDDSACLIYMTAGQVDEARRIASVLFSDRLVACVNILPAIVSIYRWEGAVQEGTEIAMIAKTRRSLVDRVVAAVRSVHGSVCPCIVAMPIIGGHGDFLDWVAAETQGDADDAGRDRDCPA